MSHVIRQCIIYKNFAYILSNVFSKILMTAYNIFFNLFSNLRFFLVINNIIIILNTRLENLVRRNIEIWEYDVADIQVRLVLG